MKKGRFESSASAKKHTKKVVALLLVMLLLVGSVVGTTLAWLTAKVDKVTDTFTIGAVGIALKAGDAAEAPAWADKDHPIVPGVPVSGFNPYLVVDANSESCWTFVKIEASAKLNFVLTDDWTLVDEEEGVYGYETIATAGQKLQIIDENVVTPASDATDDLSFAITAYAIQSNGLLTAGGAAIDNVTAAWAAMEGELAAQG